jgi:class 3 adenylate cyclase/YHS domain-containing protein
MPDRPSIQTFLFADLAGFTALTEAHGDEEAAQLAADYFESVRALLPGHHTEEIKVIGDELMLRCEDAAPALRLSVCIVHDVGTKHGFPSVRIGLNTGPAVERGGDWFGSTVNLAARIAEIASGGEILLSEATKDAAGSLGGIELRERGRRELKNVREPVLLFAAVQSGASDEAGLPIDPVCRMAVDPAHSAGTLHYQGTDYHFCSLACVAAFSSDPDHYGQA